MTHQIDLAPLDDGFVYELVDLAGAHTRGELTTEDFAAAKARILRTPAVAGPTAALEELPPRLAGGLAYGLGGVMGLHALLTSSDPRVRFHGAQALLLAPVQILAWRFLVAPLLSWTRRSSLPLDDVLAVLLLVGAAAVLGRLAQAGWRLETLRVPYLSELADALVQRTTPPGSARAEQREPALRELAAHCAPLIGVVGAQLVSGRMVVALLGLLLGTAVSWHLLRQDMPDPRGRVAVVAGAALAVAVVGALLLPVQLIVYVLG